MFDGEQRPRALSLLREMVMNKYVRPNKEKMAEGAAQVEERAAREMGIEAHYGEEELEQRGEIAVADLEKSLDNWIAYLSDANEPYPTWFRYYAFRSVLGMGDYDKDKGEFTKRSPGSTRLFPDIDRGALAYVEQMIEASKDPEMLERLRKAQQAIALNNIPESQLITKAKAEQFAKMSFAKQYAEGIKQAGEITPEMREETRGKWVKYQQGTDPTALWVSLQNKGTAWCTKGFGTAEKQLEGGDFYVYYTLDKQGKPTIPRIAIRMQEERIGEVRGVADNNQNFEENLAEVLDKKLDEPELKEKARVWKEKNADIKRLKVIADKNETKQQLTRNELIFLYEIEAPVKHFGFGDRHPEVAKIRKTRNPEEDISIIFECEPSQIATDISGVNEGTKAYVGELKSGIFESIQKYNIEHIYTSFPEGKIQRWEMELGGRTKEEIIKESEKREKFQGTEKIYVSVYAESMLAKPEFFALGKKEQAQFIKIKVEDLGFPIGATVKEIYEKAENLGLELCPPEVGPAIRLDYEKIFKKEQPRGEYFWIAMKQITDSGGTPSVFFVSRNVDGESWLHDSRALPAHRWRAGSGLVFRLRKSAD